MKFPKIQSTFGVTPYNPDRDTDEKRRAIFEHYQSQMGAQPLPPETLPWNKPFPPGVEAQQAFDTMLQERIVDPLARAGYEGLGAGLAAIPSAAHEIIVPQTEFDVGMAMSGMIPKFGKIKGALRTMPERVDETGAAFKTVGKSEFTPFEEPDVASSFGETLKKPYVEKALDPKEKMWNEIVASDPYLLDNPEYLKNLRNYFDNRWEQEQGTVEWKMMQFDMPMSERLKPKDEKSVTSGYIDELAFKRFAEPYDKIIQAQRLLAKKPGDKPVRTAIIDDKMESYFGNETKSPGSRLQDKMYPKKQMKPELEAGSDFRKRKNDTRIF